MLALAGTEPAVFAIRGRPTPLVSLQLTSWATAGLLPNFPKALPGELWAALLLRQLANLSPGGAANRRLLKSRFLEAAFDNM